MTRAEENLDTSLTKSNADENKIIEKKLAGGAKPAREGATLALNPKKISNNQREAMLSQTTTSVTNVSQDIKKNDQDSNVVLSIPWMRKEQE